MSGMKSDRPDPDEPLIADLRDYFARVDPVPPLVTQSARAALGWRRLDADLAELLADSTLEAESLAGVRGGAAAVRSVSFGHGELTLELDIHVDGPSRRLVGLITPASVARIEIQTGDGTTGATADPDATGRFRAQLAAGGRVRLRLMPSDPGGTPPIETSWITI
jgi:hypothetical protein